MSHARGMNGLTPHLTKQGYLTVERRLHLVGVDRSGALLPIAGDALFVRSNGQGSDQDSSLGRCIAKRAHLDQRFVDDEVGRYDAESPVMADPFDLLVQNGREGRQAGKIAFGINPGLDDMLAIEKVRN